MDLCRQCIVFDNIHDLSVCLGAIREDEEAHVVRIKNRFDENYNSAYSAGYRDVALNLKVLNTAAVDLGVETHVCEVQLILRPFALLKVILIHQLIVFLTNYILFIDIGYIAFLSLTLWELISHFLS